MTDIGFRDFLKKHSRKIIILVIAILIAIPLLQMIIILGIKGLLNYYAAKIVSTTGVNQYLAKAIILLVSVPFILALRWSFILNWKIGYAILSCYTALFYLSMFFLTVDTKFDFTTGKPIKWYATTPEGVRYFDAPGFDPKYGIALKPVDPGVVRRETLKGQPPKKIERPAQYFDYATGDPICWYYEDKNGNIEIYDQPGYHPRYREKLKPIIPEIVIRYEKQLSKAKKIDEERKIEQIELARIQAEIAERKRLAPPSEGRKFFNTNPFHFRTYDFGPGRGKGVDIQLLYVDIIQNRIKIYFKVKTGDYEDILLHQPFRVKDREDRRLYVIDSKGNKFYAESGFIGGNQKNFNPYVKQINLNPWEEVLIYAEFPMISPGAIFIRFVSPVLNGWQDEWRWDKIILK